MFFNPLVFGTYIYISVSSLYFSFYALKYIILVNDILKWIQALTIKIYTDPLYCIIVLFEDCICVSEYVLLNVSTHACTLRNISVLRKQMPALRTNTWVAYKRPFISYNWNNTMHLIPRRFAVLYHMSLVFAFYSRLTKHGIQRWSTIKSQMLRQIE